MKKIHYTFATIGAFIVVFGESPNVFAQAEETPQAENNTEADVETPSDVETNTEPNEGTKSLRRPNHLDFGNLVVRGQNAQRGAVYLLKRSPRPLPGLVRLRTTYRDRITSSVLGPQTQQDETQTPQSEDNENEAETPNENPNAVVPESEQTTTTPRTALSLFEHLRT